MAKKETITITTERFNELVMIENKAKMYKRQIELMSKGKKGWGESLLQK